MLRTWLFLIICVFFDLQIIPNVQITSVSVKRRYINENTSAKFMEAIAMSPTVSQLMNS